MNWLREALALLRGTPPYPEAKGPEAPPAHTLGQVVQAQVRVGPQGLGLSLLRNGPFLQVCGLSRPGPAGQSARLQPGSYRPVEEEEEEEDGGGAAAGDVLVAVGGRDIRGLGLRELGKALRDVAPGTLLRVLAYRDVLQLPPGWDTGGAAGHRTDRSCPSSIERLVGEAALAQRGHCPAHLSDRQAGTSAAPPASSTVELTVGAGPTCDVMVHRQAGPPVTSDLAQLSRPPAHSPPCPEPPPPLQPAPCCSSSPSSYRSLSSSPPHSSYSSSCTSDLTPSSSPSSHPPDSLPAAFSSGALSSSSSDDQDVHVSPRRVRVHLTAQLSLPDFSVSGSDSSGGDRD
nr:PREDICTED: PDZ domain-containing protein 9 isoform X1 [Lepisosteus oculatus]